MEYFVSQFGGWIGIAAAVIFGGFALIGLFNKNAKKLKKEETDTADSVINLLKEQVDALEKKVGQQSDEIEHLTEKVDNLTSQNKTLTEVLQGRDGSTQKFQQDAYAAMKVIEAIAQSSKENNQALTKLIAIVETTMKAKE